MSPLHLTTFRPILLTNKASPSCSVYITLYSLLPRSTISLSPWISMIPVRMFRRGSVRLQLILTNLLSATGFNGTALPITTLGSSGGGAGLDDRGGSSEVDGCCASKPLFKDLAKWGSVVFTMQSGFTGGDFLIRDECLVC